MPADLVDPAVEARRARAFDLSIQGFSNISIADLIGVSRAVVQQDILVEAERRSNETAGDRAALVARSVARYERMIADANIRIGKLNREHAEAEGWQARTAYAAILPREETLKLRAIRQLEAVQGLHQQVVIDNSDRSTTNVLVTNALEAFRNYGDGDARAEVRAIAREVRNVTPS